VAYTAFGDFQMTVV